jgi:arylsulfatase A-like enzyme
VTHPNPSIAIILHLDAISLRYLGCYGNEWVATPVLDRFAHESMVFDHCFSTLDLLDVGVRDAVLSNFTSKGVAVIWGGTSLAVTPHVGAMPLGTDLSLEALFQATSDRLTQPIVEPTVVWLDIGLSPSAWSPPHELLDHYLEDRNPFDLRGEVAGAVEDQISLDELDRLRDTYAARIATLDRHIGLFFDSLRVGGIWDRSAIILTAEQGWPLGEHDAVGFSQPMLHGERDHVPLLMKLPEGAMGGRSPSLATPADVGPTLAEWLGFAHQDSLQARSMLSILKGEPTGAREYVVSGLANAEFSIRTMGWKLILPVACDPAERPRQLYSKPEDRFEVNELSVQYWQVADHLELQLWRYLDAIKRGTTDQLAPLRPDILASS